MLFSRNPFLLNEAEGFGYVKPNKSDHYPVDNSELINRKTVKIPKEFIKRNTFIQVSSENKSVNCTDFSA